LALAKPTERRCPRLAWVALLAALSTAQSGVASDKISVEADYVSYDEASRSVEAEGNVRLQWKGSTLEAESLRVEQDTRRIRSDGPLRLTTPELHLEASSCDLDIDDETGRLTDVNMSVEDLGVTFGGREVRKFPGARYTLSDGYYTTCKSPEGRAPDWSLGGRYVDVDVGGYGVLRHGTFRIKDVPVLYLPYVAFPAHDDRQSGILLPQLGASNQRGLVIQQPYFWAIDKQQDLTLTGAVETSARIGLNADYRYRPRRDVSGEIEAAYYNEKIRGNEESDIQNPLFEGVNIPENRWMFGARHRQQLRPNVQLYGDALLVSFIYERSIPCMPSTWRARCVARCATRSTAVGCSREEDSRPSDCDRSHTRISWTNRNRRCSAQEKPGRLSTGTSEASATSSTESSPASSDVGGRMDSVWTPAQPCPVI
jgi:lipopolysaccharide assembly outer membrane protein LptD (OstA)